MLQFCVQRAKVVADLLLIMAEVSQEEEFGRMQSELYLNGVRLNEVPPKVEIKKTLLLIL